MTFSVELVNLEGIPDRSHHVEIHIDQDNLRSLIARLHKLSEHVPGEHIHFMTESWGLGDLTEEAHGEDNVITNHLKIVLES